MSAAQELGKLLIKQFDNGKINRYAVRNAIIDASYRAHYEAEAARIRSIAKRVNFGINVAGRVLGDRQIQEYVGFEMAKMRWVHQWQDGGGI